MEICALLYQLGVTRNYKGFPQTALAVELCAEQRNIRTVSGVIWRSNPLLLNELAYVSLPQKPCPAQLLSILAASVGFR